MAPLRRRLVAVVIGLIAVAAAAIGVASTLALRGTLVSQLDQRLLGTADRAAAAQDEGRPTPAPGQTPPTFEPPPGLVARGQGVGTLTMAVQADGVVRSGYLDESGATQTLTDAQEAVLRDVPADGRTHTVDVAGLGSWRVVAFSPRSGETLVSGLSLAEVTSTVRSYLALEVAIAGVGLLVAAGAGTALVRRELAPLERVAATATRVSEQPLEHGAVTLERVPAVDTDAATEVGQVGAALNRLLGHVEAALAARHASETQVRQFVADASHELRTPLASIRGYAELVRRLPEELPEDAVRAMERVESESRRMTALVEDMLLLARLDAGRGLDVGRGLDADEVDLAVLAADAVADAHVAGPDHAWRLDVPGPEDDADDAAPAEPDTLVRGDDHRLRQVLVNLLSNARVHTPAGTTVSTSVRREGRHVVVRVSDDGPGIAADLVPRLFQRFARGDESRTPGKGSTGLGLAIVDAVVAAHGGSIDVDGTPGATTFTVRLPAA
jgi:two-component system OmpR family sensor kinase